MDYRELKRKVLRAVDDRRDEIIKTVREIIQIPSVVGNEGEAQIYVKEKFKELRRVIGAVGHKALGTWNPVVMGVLLLRGDSRVLKYLDANDSFNGTLQAAFDSIKGRYITPSMIAQAVQAVVLAVYANEGGLNTIRDTILTNANTILADMVSFAVISGYTASYSLEWNATVNNVKVVAELTSTA